jgi:arsenate reductase
MKKRVLFICNRNAGRSQMAEALLRHHYGDEYEVYSAGTDPSSSVNPYAIAVMGELGIDMTHHRPKNVLEFFDMALDVVVFLCVCEESCFRLPKATHVIKIEFMDPSVFTGSNEEIMKGFRGMRNRIKEWIDNTLGKGGDLF